MVVHGRRFKRIERSHRVREEAAEWAAQHEPAALEHGMRAWLEGLPVDDVVMLYAAMEFALLIPQPDGPSLIRRFVEATSAGDRSRLDREICNAWIQAEYGLFEVQAVRRGQGFTLLDVHTELLREIDEVRGSLDIEPGEWMAGFVLPTVGRRAHEMGNPTLRVPIVARLEAVQERLALPGDANPGEAAVRIVGRVYAALRPPCFRNHDGHPIAPTTTRLDLTFDELVHAADAWEAAVGMDDQVAVLGRYMPALGGPLVLGELSLGSDGAVRLFTNSAQRAAQVLEMWPGGTPPAVLERHTQPVKSNPDGPELLVDSAYGEAETVEEGERSFRENLVQGWLDRPIPLLGGLSPREAAASGRRAEVRATVPAILTRAEATQVRRELGIERVTSRPSVRPGAYGPG